MATMVTSQDVSGHSISRQPARQPSAAQSLNIREFSFATQSRFNAGRDLVLTRSDSYVIRKPPKEFDIWEHPPPDFRPQQYLPKPPKRNSRESMQPWKYGTFPGQKKAMSKTEGKKSVALPKILQPVRPRSEQMVTRFKIDDPHEARAKFVREGMYPKEQYQMPKKHDFRGYPPLGPLGLPEFVTAPEHDPYNIHFKSRNRDIIVGLPQPRSERSEGRQMGQAMTPQPRYQPELIMPSLKWPTTSGEFTRFRRKNRSPHTVLFDQIEDTLEERWKQEDGERERIQKEMERDKREKQFREEVARQLVARTQMPSASTVRSPWEGGDNGQTGGRVDRQMSGQKYSDAGSHHGSRARMGSHGNSRDEDAYSRSVLSSANEYSMDVS
ncbi:uncharacterized protein LOC119723010 [Patiria miniata]|uniref:Uncharacterized protein n=1 Tax=Patiria miniata TaxID=46514 RepID=A0A913ZC99_PATMI|nr:uncharacterized protein LOC119723010 [Patiria miniata]